MKSILFRLSARLCIATLLFQSLWPTVVLATETEVLRPLAAPSTLPAQSEPPQYNLETFITDDMGKEPPKTARVSFPILETRQETQAYIDGASDIQSLYKNLHITGEGLEWSSYGFDFLMHYTGHLLVTPQAQTPQSKALGIYHNMDVWLGDGINLDVMHVQGRHIVHRGKESHIGRLELKALGTKKSPGWIFNGDTASLAVKEMYVLEGQLRNQGDLFLAAGGKLDMGGNSFVNEKLLNIGRGSVIENVDILKNTGSVEGIGGEIRGNQLDNQGKIATDTLKVTTTLAFNNAKEITTKVRAELTSLGSFSNAGTLASDGALKTNVKEGTNTGTISSKGTLDAVFTGTFHNKGSFISQGASHVTVTGLLLNESGGLFKSHSSLAFLGGGEVRNSGTISAMGLLSLENRLFMNEGLLCADGDFRFSLAERFINSGSLVVKGQTVISGKGEIANELPIQGRDTGRLVFEGDVVFDNYQGKIVNNGLFNSKKTMSGVLHRLENTGTFGADNGFNKLEITYLGNGGTLIGDGFLTVRRGINRHLIQSKKLTLSIVESFFNDGTLAVSDEFMTTGAGEFIQKGIVKAARVIIDNARFENQALKWIEENTVLIFGEHVIDWKNAKGSSIGVRAIEFKRGLQPTTILNEGTLMAIRLVNQSQSLRNCGTIKADRLEQGGAKVINEGNIEIQQATLLDADTIENTGSILLGGSVTGSLTHGINKGDWTFSGKTTLKGKDFINEKLLRAEALFEWIGETFDNKGKALIFDNHIAATRQFINRNLFFWTHNTVRGMHIYNEGLMCLMDITDPLALDAKPYERVSTRTPVYKHKTLENLGKILMNPKYAYRFDLTDTATFDAWINEGTLEARNLSVKAKTFDNQGTLQTAGNYSFEGKSFTSGDKSHVRAGGILKIDTQDPLLLQGVAQGDKGVTLKSAVSFENKAELHNPTGEMFIDTPQIINRRLINADTFVYEGKSLLNYDTFEANTYGREKFFDTLLNEKTFIVRQGGFVANRLINRGTVKKDPKDDKKYLSRGLQLHKGSYLVGLFDNLGGEADIDRFASIQGSPSETGEVKLDFSIAGKLRVNEWIEMQIPYNSMCILGDVTVCKGKIWSKKLENRGAFLLGEGTHRFDLFENLKDASGRGGDFCLSPKSDVTVDTFANAGLVDTDGNLHLVLGDARGSRPALAALSGAVLRIKKLACPPPTYVPENKKHPLKFSDRWQAGKNLILDLDDAANPLAFLFDMDRFSCGESLCVRAKTWDTREKFSIIGQSGTKLVNYTFGTTTLEITKPLVLDVIDYIYSGTFTFKALTLSAQTFSTLPFLSSGKQTLSRLDVFGPLNITVSGDLDCREGKIRALEKTTVKANRILVGAPQPEGPNPEGYKYKTNEAAITSSDELTMIAQDIIADFGQLYSQDTLTLTAGRRIATKSGSILSSRDIRLTAPILDVLLGDLHVVSTTALSSIGISFTRSGDIVDGTLIPSGAVSAITRQGFTSRPGHIMTTGGSIWIKTTTANVKGAKILASHGVYYAKSGPGLSSSLHLEEVMAPGIVQYADGLKFVDTCRSLAASDRSHTSIKGGKAVDVSTGRVRISGSVDAPAMKIEADQFVLQAPVGATGGPNPFAGGNILVNLLSVLSHISTYLPYVLDPGGEVRMDHLERPVPLPFDLLKLPVAIEAGKPLTATKVFFEPDILAFTAMYALSEICGILSVYEKSGTDLLLDLYKRGKKVEADVGKLGKILTCDYLKAYGREGLLFNRAIEITDDAGKILGLYLVPHLLLTPDMARPHANVAGALTGNKIHVHTTQSTTLQRAVISGRDDVSVTSDGTIAILRDKQVVERQIPGGVSRQEFSDPAVLIECTKGSAKVVSKKDFKSVASDLRAAKDVEAGSTEGDAKFTSQKLSGDTHREEDTRFGHETHDERHETADVQRVTAGGSVTLKAGKAKTLSTTAVQTVAGKDITTQGGHHESRSMPLRQETTDTYEQGGRTSRSGGSHTETVEVLRETHLAGSDINWEGTTGSFEGALIRWGLTDPAGTLHNKQKRTYLGPIEFDTHDVAWAQRRSKGWGGFGKKSAGSHTSRDVHYVVPLDMGGPHLDMQGPGGGERGELIMKSVHMAISGTSYIGMHIHQMTAQGRVHEVSSSFTKNGLGLSLPKLPSASFKEHGALGQFSHGVEVALPYLQAANQALAYANGQLSLTDILCRQFGTLTWGQSRFHSVLDQVADVPNIIHWGARAKFADDTLVHLKGYNRVGAVEGKLRRLSTEPLRQTTRYESASQSSTTSVNLFTTTVSHGEQRARHVREREEFSATILEIDQSAHLVVTGDVDLFGGRICGAGDVDLEVMGDLIGRSPQDTDYEETDERHWSVSVNVASAVSSAMACDPLGVAAACAGSGFGDRHERRKDVAVSEAGQSGITPEGTLKLKVHKDAKLTDFPVEGGRGTEFTARSKCIETQPEIHEYSETSNTMGSLLRAFTATMGLIQEVQQLAEHLAPKPLQRELYQALEEEGVEPTASMEILADPEVREVVEEVQQYVDKQILRQQKGKGKVVEPVRSPSLSSSSAAAVSSAVQSLADASSPSQYILPTETFAELLLVKMAGDDLCTKRPDRAEQIQAVTDRLSLVVMAAPYNAISLGISAHRYTQEHPIECMVNAGFAACPAGWARAAGAKYLSPFVMPVLERTGISAVGASVKGSVSSLLKAIAEKSTPITAPIRGAFAKIAESCGFREAATETGELAGFKSAFWEEPKAYTFNGQTNKVYGRSDLIDPLRVDTKSGLTSLQLMKEGRPPIGPDNNPIQLHHMLQTKNGPIAMVTQTFHQIYTRIIHINPTSIRSAINRPEFNAWRSDFWMDYAAAIEKKLMTGGI